MFEYPEPPKKSFGSKFLKTATDIAPSVITVGAMSGNRAALNALYKMNYYTYTNNAYSTTSTLFSAVNNVARKENIQTSLSVLESIDKTKDDLEKFLKKKID
jgi:hypothetical protein